MIDTHETALRVADGSRRSERSDTVDRVLPRRKTLTRAQYVEGILNGDRAILAQAITLVESSRPADRDIAEEVIEQCLHASGNSRRIGITGVPGAGKSSLIEALGNFVIAEYGQKLAVLAVDPSSERTGGSILGDKTRMATLAASDMAFVRPSPSRGSFGGVAQHTREAMLLCEAAGYRIIIIETVGVGQSETAVYNMVDFFLLLGLAGAGDELQGMKRGIMELADLVAINKADGENTALVEKAVTETNNALHFLPSSSSGWKPRAMACSALTGRGIAEIWDSVLQHAAITRANEWWDENRRQQRLRWMRETLELGLRQLFSAYPLIATRMATYERDVLDGRTTPFRAARVLIEMYAHQRSGSTP